MKIEDHRDKRDREHQAGDDAKPQFEPNRIQRDLAADALALPVTAIEIVRKDRQQRAEEQLKHGSLPPSASPHPARRHRWRERERDSASRSGLPRARHPPSSRPITRS